MESLEIYDSINNRQLSIYVTPEIARKCRADNGFVQDLFNNLQDQHLEEGSTLDIETIKKEVVEDPLFEELLEEKTDKESWSRRETLKLIKVYQKYKNQFKEHVQSKTVWSMIANELSQLKVYKSPIKCKDKWKNLMRTYKVTSEKPTTPTRFHYFQEVNDVLNDVEVSVSDSDSGDEVDVKFNATSLNCLEIKEEPKESWSRYETLMFLKAFQQHKDIKKNFPREKRFWSLISAELAKSNIQKPPEKCATKWKNLFRSYKRNADKSTPPMRFQYFQEVSDVMNGTEINFSENMHVADDVGFEKILDPEEFKCFLEETEIESTHRDNSKDPVTWTADETLKLIRAYKKHKHKFKKCPARKYVWAMIATELAKDGIHKDQEKCENKWKSLMRSYKKGAGSQRFYFYDEVHSVLNEGNMLSDSEVSPLLNEDSYDDSKFLETAHSLENGVYLKNEDTESVDLTDNINYEEIIIQTEEDEIEDSKYWSYNDTLSLIKAYATHRKKFNSLETTAQIWKDISAELETLNIHQSDDNCKNKWQNLFNEYKTYKVNKMGPETFPFYDEMDEIFDSATEIEDSEENLFPNKKCKCMKNKILEKQNRHIERMQLLKKRLELEERKLVAFEAYVNHLKSSC